MRALVYATLTGCCLLASFPLLAAPVALTRQGVGQTPPEFESLLTGGGPPPLWQVIEDATSVSGVVLAQLSADSTDHRFPLAVYRPVSARNVLATVRFKAVSGTVDRAAGIAVRITDANNYYVVRANALENNVNFYRVVNGRREEIKGARARVTSGTWHSLSLRAADDHFTIFFNGAELFSATDRTFAKPGRVGLWTKADSITSFEALNIEELP